MNKQRKKRLGIVWSELESIIEEEQESLDNIPENLESSNAATAMEESIDKLEEAKELIGDIVQ